MDEAALKGFYHLPEGSEVFPLSWFFALRTKDDKRFADNLGRFGLLTDPKSDANPHGLPVGVTAAQTKDLRFLGFEMIGFNCAACHVGEIAAEGKRFRVVGGPNMFDIKAFYAELFGTLKETVTSVDRVLRFLRDLHQGGQPDLAAALPEQGIESLAEAPPSPRALRRSMVDSPAPATQKLLQAPPLSAELERKSDADKALLKRMKEILDQEQELAPQDFAKSLEVLPSQARAPDKPAPSPAPAAAPVPAKPAAPGRPGIRTVKPRAAFRTKAELPPSSVAPRKGVALAAERPARPVGRISIDRAKQPAYLKSFVGDELAHALEVSKPEQMSSALAAIPAEQRSTAVGEFLADFSVTVRLLKARISFLATVAQLDIHETPAGPGRVDAFMTARNLIFGKATAVATDSPIDYPHLWGLAGIAWLHWDANTNSVMERNVGQALGLGAVVDTTRFVSTVEPRNLNTLEEVATQITSPKWPFGALDQSLLGAGKVLFDKHCLKCHATDAAQHDLMTPLAEIRTDERRALNFAKQLGDKSFDKELSLVLGKIKQRAYLDHDVTPEEQAKFERGRLPSVWRTTSSYANRSLAGVWATAPYLHNGSVPTLADLLKEPGERPKTFALGGRRYDTANVGYRTDASNGSFVFKTTDPGNGNAGHEYGTKLVSDEKKALLEYLKSL